MKKSLFTSFSDYLLSCFSVCMRERAKWMFSVSDFLPPDINLANWHQFGGGGEKRERGGREK